MENDAMFSLTRMVLKHPFPNFVASLVASFVGHMHLLERGFDKAPDKARDKAYSGRNDLSKKVRCI